MASSLDGGLTENGVLDSIIFMEQVDTSSDDTCMLRS